MNRNYKIDKLRVVSAMMVIVIHTTSYIYHSGNAIFLITTFIVNYLIFDFVFFAVSGCFLGEKNDLGNIRKSINNMFGIFIVSSIGVMATKIFLV